MSLIKWNNGLFRPFLSNFSDDFFETDSLLPQWSKLETLPATNIEEKDKSFVIKIALPGMEKKDIKIEKEEGMLKISAEKEISKSEDNKKYTRKEYEYSSFQRSFALPSYVEADKITAECKNGELMIVLPKNEIKVPEPKQIPIAG